MSIMKKIKDSGKRLMNNIKENQEIIKQREQILAELTIPQLEQLADDYDININFNQMFEEEPRIYDYVRSIARSRLSAEKIEEHIRKIKRKEEIELSVPKSEQYVTQTIFQDKVSMSQTSIGGNVNVIQNIFNDFSLAIMNSNIDPDIKKQAFQKIEELKKEISKPNKEKSIIDRICKWFTENKTELATISIPFITKILTSI